MAKQIEIYLYLTLSQNVALVMLNKPYTGFLLDQKIPEYLWVSTEHTDCMLFIEHVWAISMMIQTQDSSQKSLTDYISQIRYHGPVNFCNRNHYFKDWALSNQSKEILQSNRIKQNTKLLPKVYLLSKKIVQ